MRIKRLIGFLDKLDDLLDEHTKNFILERPFLWMGATFDCENLEEEERENNLKIKKVVEAISEGLDTKLLEETRETTQEILL